jgi:predicted enzyme related to lactoylglutathione lyase
MLCPKGIAHAGLKAQDLVSLSAYYEDRVGLTLVERHDGCHIFDIGGGALFEIWSGGTSSPNRKSASQQSVRVCFLVERLEPSIENLRARGVAPMGEIGSYLGTRWVHYTDPEGNAFGLVDSSG